MQNSGKDNFQTCTNDRSIAARYAPIHSMLTELLAKTDPDGYALMLQDFRDQYKPEGGEAHLVEFMADLAWRIQGCFYLENEILTQGMEACGPKDDPGLALARAFMRESKGGGLLSKLSRYQSRLSSEFTRCIRILELRAKNRKYAEARMAATLAKRKPCTSVIQ